jgi:hypothetical protein
MELRLYRVRCGNAVQADGILHLPGSELLLTPAQAAAMPWAVEPTVQEYQEREAAAAATPGRGEDALPTVSAAREAGDGGAPADDVRPSGEEAQPAESPAKGNGHAGDGGSEAALAPAAAGTSRRRGRGRRG